MALNSPGGGGNASASSTSTPPTIDLSTVTDPVIRHQIEELLRQNQLQTPPQPTIQTQYTTPPTYADMAAHEPTPATAPTNTPTPFPTHDEELIDDDNPFIPVQPRNTRQPRSATRDNYPGQHLDDRISGVIGASTELWNDHEVNRILNQDDLINQQRRHAEGRAENIPAITRPAIWIKYFFPETIPTLTVKPNVLQQELAIDVILSHLHLPFTVDRLYICTLRPIQRLNNTQCFLGFAALSPSTSLLYGSSNTHNRTVISQLYTLENRLFCLFQDPILYRTSLTHPPPQLLQHMTFRLPSVNHHTETFSAIIAGLPPQIPHNDVATLREIATDIFRSVHATYIANPIHNTFPEVLHRHTSRFHINQLISVRQ